MVTWTLKHEGEAGFDSVKILPAWAQKRGRGYWRVEDRRIEECCLPVPRQRFGAGTLQERRGLVRGEGGCRVPPLQRIVHYAQSLTTGF